MTDAPQIRNPVLPGFHPDPSILRVGNVYYIATSTFEWFPGVQLHRSADLVHWTAMGGILTRKRQLDLLGVPDSGGVWAPCLSHDGERFHLVYSIVRTRSGKTKDLMNYLVTADNAAGPWSDPVPLNGRGIDPSLFHDVDGRKWLLQVQWDQRPGHPSFAGIVVQEYDPAGEKLVGPSRMAFQAETLVEGPHLYRVGDHLYLLLAEGGTSWNHAALMARGASPFGPFETDPRGPMLTTRDRPDWPLQKAGHGDLVETPEGEWYLAFLCARPLGDPPRCVLGRETALAPVEWDDDGWPRLQGGGTLPPLTAAAPAGIRMLPPPAPPERDEFEGGVLSPAWNAPRRPIDPGWCSLTERPGYLRLRGGESTRSLFEQSLLAQRLCSTCRLVETRMEFDPVDVGRAAGLICYYDTADHHYLRLTVDDDGVPFLGVMTLDDGRWIEHGGVVRLKRGGAVGLRAVIDGGSLRFACSAEDGPWREIGPVLDMGVLSDEHGTGLKFTGAFVGLCVQDLTGERWPADFACFLNKKGGPPSPE